MITMTQFIFECHSEKEVVQIIYRKWADLRLFPLIVTIVHLHARGNLFWSPVNKVSLHFIILHTKKLGHRFPSESQRHIKRRISCLNSSGRRRKKGKKDL